MTALTNSTAHGPPVGFGIIIGFVNTLRLPCMEFFRLTEHDWDIRASADDDNDVMVTDSSLPFCVTVIVNGVSPLVANPLVADPLVALVDMLMIWSHMELSIFIVRLPMFVVENMVVPGF